MKITMKPTIFKLIYAPTFILNRLLLGQIYQERLFLVQSKANEHYHWILHGWISLGGISLHSKFHLNQAITFLRPNLPRMCIFSPKQGKWTFPLNSAYLNQCKYIPNFILNRQFYPFRTKFSPKLMFLVQNKTSGHYYQILHIWTSITTIFHLKQAALIF